MPALCSAVTLLLLLSKLLLLLLLFAAAATLLLLPLLLLCCRSYCLYCWLARETFVAASVVGYCVVVPNGALLSCKRRTKQLSSENNSNRRDSLTLTLTLRACMRAIVRETGRLLQPRWPLT